MDDFSNNHVNLKNEFLRYLSFWYLFVLAFIVAVTISYFDIRFSNQVYQSEAKIKILDDAMDSDMALPTSMTIFNRSTINLENEIAIISSERLLRKVVLELDLTTSFYTDGRVKTTRNHKTEWMNGLDYEFSKKNYLDYESIFKSYELFFVENGIEITEKSFIDDVEITYSFDGFDTKSSGIVDLPFEFSISPDLVTDDLSKNSYMISFHNSSYALTELSNSISVSQSGSKSDILNIIHTSDNSIISRNILDELINIFDNDGIVDRQLLFKNTIEFVDSRFNLLKRELDSIEFSKQQFKVDNNLSFLNLDAGLVAETNSKYTSEILNIRNQVSLVDMLIDNQSFLNQTFIPINIGLNNLVINDAISKYNNLIIERDKLSLGVGANNALLKNLILNIKRSSSNILTSLSNYKVELELTIQNIESQSQVFKSNFQNIPYKEKSLRSITRQQEIKEALFLLLLQKKEEAAINYAVTKPSIKVIDLASTNPNHIYPISNKIYLKNILFSFLIPFVLLYLWFFFDDKIHTKQDLVTSFPSIPVLSDIPFFDNPEAIIDSKISRSPLAETFRILVSNFKFILDSKSNNKLAKRILVTSTLKGEGKTFIAVNLASVLTSTSKVLLIGTDLRNPQIHNLIGTSKDVPGLTNYIIDKDLNIDDVIVKKNKITNLDIILSGVIPPNPTELLASDRFKFLLDQASINYDYIIIDSAPCLLVSDTFVVSEHIDYCLYTIRANFFTKRLAPFITDLKDNNKLPNINLIFNSVGTSSSYGYKYGYQYGYKYGYSYGYKYGYNYGYGYDYENNK